MAVILQRFSTEISSSGLGRRPLTAETRVRVPVSLPNKAFSRNVGGFCFVVWFSMPWFSRRQFS